MKKKAIKQGYFAIKLTFFIVKEIMEQISLFSLFPRSKKTLGSPSTFLYQGFPVFLNRRPYERSLKLCVKKQDMIHISCSLSTSLKEIKSFLSTHWPWIKKQILKNQKIRRKYPEKTFREGESFLFRGRKLKLKYQKVSSQKQASFYEKEDNLIYCFRDIEDLNRDLLKKKLRAFYEGLGRSSLKSAVSVFSARMGLFPKSLRIGAQKTLWGSCSSKGHISLNWRLSAALPQVLNYVVIHELAHLKHLNHSSNFWSLVAKFSPQYKEHEHWLKNNNYALDFLLPHSELHK